MARRRSAGGVCSAERGDRLVYRPPNAPFRLPAGAVPALGRVARILGPRGLCRNGVFAGRRGRDPRRAAGDRRRLRLRRALGDAPVPARRGAGQRRGVPSRAAARAAARRGVFPAGQA